MIEGDIGDYAQYCCIKKWLKENYNQREIIEIPSSPIGHDYCGVMSELKKKISIEDIIVFQSGYTSSNTHDDEIVHRKIINSFKENKVVFFPQTVKYTSLKQAQKTAKIYNNHKHILFIARDMVSYNIAKKYFKKVKLLMMPDIVTTMIGTRKYNHKRKGILFCIRHDSEKEYLDAEIKQAFKEMCSNDDEWNDTTLSEGEKCSEETLNEIIEKFSKHSLVVTDRFHGTIFSLIASTPVIVLKTSDHKVSEGAEWFLDLYKNVIKKSNDLENALYYSKLLLKSKTNTLKPYFKEKYYDHLKEEIDSI